MPDIRSEILKDIPLLALLNSPVDGQIPTRHSLTAISRKLPESLQNQIGQLASLNLPKCHADDVALQAGLFLWHDAMDDSHACAQSIEGEGKHRAGDYWHAILHRREPDYPNAKYWFRQVGPHPNFPDLGRRAEPLIAAVPEWRDRLLRNGWDPLAFVDFCEQAVAGQNAQWIAAAEQIQEIEMLLLLASTYRDASH